ncbi:MAG TPA: acyl-CoA dehydrogenase, partial [Bacteroidales bacterium]|nr:acyl-CoA dehydrogenase [Bacteroidales bacterium]
AETIHEFGSEEIKDEYLPRFNKGATAAMDLTEPDAGSDLQAVQLKATLDPQSGIWYLNGVKRFITNGDADISLVLARSEPNTSDARGLSLFVYDRTQKAVKIRRIENKLGIKGSPTCELVFKNAPAKLIGDTRMGLIKYVMSLMNSARLGVGAQSVGLAEAAWREALKYAQEREQFGKSIIQYPAVYEMITNMQVKTDAIRTLLYETARFVDVYKAYTYAGKERKLEPAEREEFKYYTRMADVFTPLLKLFSSEYCNQIAYDAIQIHGGTGYMKDFPVERIWRDARITTIYEGTSQLQVVAAIRGVGNGLYLKAMQTYHETAVKPELQYLKSVLEKMTDQYAKTVIKVNEFEDNEYLDYHARRLVEMAGNVIMGYLLLIDANRNNDYTKSADIFIRIARAENIAKVGYINQSHPKDLGTYKQV